MAAHKNPSPPPPQPERPGFVNLRFRFRLRRPQPHDHAEGGRRGAVRGRGQEAAALPRRGSPPRRGGGEGGRRREGAGGDGRGGDRELSSRSPPRPRRGGGDGRRLEGGGGAGRGGDGDLWSGLPLPRRGGKDGGRRRQGAGGASRGGNVELWLGSPPPRRGWGVGGRRREGAGGAGRGGHRELSSRSPPPPPPPRRGGEDGGGGRRREGAGGASRGGDVELWSGLQPPRRGWGDGDRRREEAGGAGRGGDGELSSGSPLPPRQGVGDGRRRDGRSGSAGRGIYGERSAGSSSVGGNAAELGSGVVHTCHVCSKTFDRVKALHGHMRSCRAAAEELPPSVPRQERANKHMVEKKKADDEGLLARALERGWAVTWRRRRGRIPSHGGGEPLAQAQDRAPVAAILREVTRRRRRRRGRTPSHGGGESRAPPAKRACVAAQDRAPVAAMLCEVTGLQVGGDDLDQPWAAEMVRAAQDLMLLSAGEAGFGPITDGQSEQSVVTVAVPAAKIPKVKVPEPPSTVSNSPVVPDTDVIVIDDDDDEEDVEPNSAIVEMNASAVTIAISAPDTAETVTIAPAPDAAAAVTITAAPATPSAVAIATAPATAATAVTIEAGPNAAKGKEIAFSNGNGGGSAIAGAGEIKVYRCPKCSKTFRSYQALGGHMANHKINEKRAKELQDVKDVAAAMAAVMDGRALHVCAKCSKTFPTGQALGGHMRLHYAGQLLGAGKTTAWAASSTASGLSLPGPAAAGSSSFVFTLLKQEELPEEMAMAGNVVPVYAPAATAFGLSLPAAISSFRLAFATPKQEQEKTPEVMARAPRNGTRGGFRLFGVDIAEGPKEEAME